MFICYWFGTHYCLILGLRDLTRGVLRFVLESSVRWVLLVLSRIMKVKGLKNGGRFSLGRSLSVYTGGFG